MIEPQEPAIDLKGLSKRFSGSKTYAIKDLTLKVMPGEVYGYLGSNGAGKSTTIRCLLNFIQPTHGSGTILGMNIVNDSVKVKHRVGYLAGDVALYPKMTGKQFFSYMSDLHPTDHRGYLKKLTSLFDATLNKPLQDLSKGNRQKIGVIQAFMSEPDVLILDEPTTGLDPLMQEHFFNLVKETKERGASLFISSHNFAEVQRMCDRIGFLRDGKLVAEERLDDLAKKAAHTFIITFKDKSPLKELHSIPRAKVVPHNDRHVRVIMTGELGPLFTILAKHPTIQFDQEEINLEEQFLHFYGKGK